jgi:hypothetical protein
VTRSASGRAVAHAGRRAGTGQSLTRRRRRRSPPCPTASTWPSISPGTAASAAERWRSSSRRLWPRSRCPCSSCAVSRTGSRLRSGRRSLPPGDQFVGMPGAHTFPWVEPRAWSAPARGVLRRGRAQRDPPGPPGARAARPRASPSGERVRDRFWPRPPREPAAPAPSESVWRSRHALLSKVRVSLSRGGIPTQRGCCSSEGRASVPANAPPMSMPEWMHSCVWSLYARIGQMVSVAVSAMTVPPPRCQRIDTADRHDHLERPISDKQPASSTSQYPSACTNNRPTARLGATLSRSASCVWAVPHEGSFTYGIRSPNSRGRPAAPRRAHAPRAGGRRRLGSGARRQSSETVPPGCSSPAAAGQVEDAEANRNRTPRERPTRARNPAALGHRSRQSPRRAKGRGTDALAAPAAPGLHVYLTTGQRSAPGASMLKAPRLPHHSVCPRCDVAGCPSGSLRTRDANCVCRPKGRGAGVSPRGAGVSIRRSMHSCGGFGCRIARFGAGSRLSPQTALCALPFLILQHPAARPSRTGGGDHRVELRRPRRRDAVARAARPSPQVEIQVPRRLAC